MYFWCCWGVGGNQISYTRLKETVKYDNVGDPRTAITDNIVRIKKNK